MNIERRIDRLRELNLEKLYFSDLCYTWEKTDDEIEAILLVAETLRQLRLNNRSCRIFDSGLAVSLLGGVPAHTNFSFGFAVNLLGLDLRTVELQAPMVMDHPAMLSIANTTSYMSDVLGVKEHSPSENPPGFIRSIASLVQQSYEDRILEQRPTLMNLQDDVDHPVQALADLFHISRFFGGYDNLRGKKLALTWAHSAQHQSPSVAQSVLGLMSRTGMNIALAHPDGFELMPEVMELSETNARVAGARIERVSDMTAAFQDADIVCPINWSPVALNRKHAAQWEKGNTAGLVQIEREIASGNRKYRDWECNEEAMRWTKEGKALYMRRFPIDITGVNCKHGELTLPLFERFRENLFYEAGLKPYIIAAVIFLSKIRNPSELLTRFAFDEKPTTRVLSSPVD